MCTLGDEQGIHVHSCIALVLWIAAICRLMGSCPGRMSLNVDRVAVKPEFCWKPNKAGTAAGLSSAHGPRPGVVLGVGGSCERVGLATPAHKLL